MKLLYIGGTGDISYECLRASVAAGHKCAIFNRGRDPDPLPPGVARITGDLTRQADYAQLGRENFDVVCQFVGYTPSDARRDLQMFSGRCGQFIFVSTASAYLKAPPSWRIAEDTPLGNPFWDYSQQKADAETLLMEAHGRGELPVTVVRPSLTYRRKFPGTFVSGDDHAWRILQGRPVIVHGDGQTLWTFTHARDFAKLFVPLLGNPQALGQAFHIMTDTVFTWDFLFRAVGSALGVEPRLVHVPTQTLVRYNAQWTGPLLGDKAWSSVFDTSKIRRISGTVTEPVSVEEGFSEVRRYFEQRMTTFQPDAAPHELMDRIAREQESLGRAG